jgi:hypothetical protein
MILVSPYGVSFKKQTTASKNDQQVNFGTKKFTTGVVINKFFERAKDVPGMMGIKRANTWD